MQLKGMKVLALGERDGVPGPAIEAAVAQACAGLEGDLLAQLAALEDALIEAPLMQRVPS